MPLSKRKRQNGIYLAIQFKYTFHTVSLSQYVKLVFNSFSIMSTIPYLIVLCNVFDSPRMEIDVFIYAYVYTIHLRMK